MNSNPNETNSAAKNDPNAPPAQKNFHNLTATTNYPPPPPSISGRSTASFNPNIPPPMAQPAFMPPPQTDWWNPYQYSQMPYDDINNSTKSKKNHSVKPKSSTTTTATHGQSGSESPQTKKNMNNQQMSQMNQFMDPAYMYYMMAAAAAAYSTPFGAYPPPSPFVYPHMAQMNQSRYYPDDDQRSVKSFLDIDNRSEKHIDQNRARSITGDQVKIKQSPPGLLMPEHTINEELELNREMNNLNLNKNEFIVSRRDEEVLFKEQQHERVNRMTPMLHQLPHVRCLFSIDGLVRVRPNDPCDGQPALVDIFSLSDFMENYLSNVKKSAADENQEETVDEASYKHDLDDFNFMNDDVRNEILTNFKLVQEFPGPLCKDLNTSKAQVIQFCLKNVRECLSSNTSLIDPQSHALLWDFLALLVRQNGLVDLKTDISPLLLSGLVENAEVSLMKRSESSQTLGQAAQDFVMVKQKEDESNQDEINLNRLRQLLGAGQKSEAIDFSIKHNMWSHSLFLASSAFNSSSQTQSLLNDAIKPNLNTIFSESKMLTKVKLRFINSLPQNDPIITCYQLLMGRVPTAASNLSKWEWNDWRRHLAMIVSNIDETNENLVLNTIKTMGDSLASNGRIAASHFCYLLSNCSFGTYEKKSSKLVLIGSSHNQDFGKFCQIGAIQATEVFEYAQSMLPNSTQFNSDNFIKYKLIYANKLVEHGLMHEAYKYIEIISKAINNNPSIHKDKLSSVYHLANKLKIYDPDYFNLEDSSQFQEPIFIAQLSKNYFNLYSKNISHLISTIQPLALETQQASSALLQDTKMEPKVEQISFVEPFVTEHAINYQNQHSMPFQPNQQIVDNEQIKFQSIPNDQNITYQGYQNYQEYQAPVDYYQTQMVDPIPSRKSSINSVHQQPLNQLSHEKFNYNQPYYQPNYNQQTNRSRASSTSTSYENNLQSSSIQTQVYDPTKSMPKSQTFPQNNYYQPIFTPEINNAIEEDPNVNKPQQISLQEKNDDDDDDDDDDLSTANPKSKPIKQEEESKTDLSKKQDDSKKGSLWDWFKKPAGPKKMILPDDKKKTIVWDDKLKKFVNKDNESSSGTESVKPPPPISTPVQSMPNLSDESTSNKFSLRNTNSKRPSNYYAKLDILADKRSKAPSNDPTTEIQPFAQMVSNLPPPIQLPPRFFVPDSNKTNMHPVEPEQQQHQQQQQTQQNMYFNPALNPTYSESNNNI